MKVLRAGVRRPNPGRLVRLARREAALHRARQTDPECLCRDFQREVPGWVLAWH